MNRDPCSKIVSRFHEWDRTSFPSRLKREESANFSSWISIPGGKIYLLTSKITRADARLAPGKTAAWLPNVPAAN